MLEKRHRYILKLAVSMLFLSLCGCGAAQTTSSPVAPLTLTSTPTSTFPSMITKTSTSTTVATTTSTVAPRIFGEEISFTTEDDLRISGYIYPGGEDQAVILAHQRSRPQPGPPETQKSWQYFAEALATEGYTVLTFDFRGIGRSEGDIDEMENEVVKDTHAAIEFLRSEGFDHVVCAGAEMGGTSCMEAAQNYELEGLVVITSTLSLGEPSSITDDDIARLTMPKLFISTDQDRFERIVGETQYLFDNSPEPKQLKFFSGTAHGTELFFTEHAEEFRQLLFDFFETAFKS